MQIGCWALSRMGWSNPLMPDCCGHFTGLQGCDWLSDPVIVVKNVERDVIHDISLEVGGGAVDLGAIPAGESRAAKPEIAADSSLVVTYYENNARVVCHGDVYFTNNLYVRVEADVGGGVCRIAEVAD